MQSWSLAALPQRCPILGARTPISPRAPMSYFLISGIPQWLISCFLHFKTIGVWPFLLGSILGIFSLLNPSQAWNPRCQPLPHNRHLQLGSPAPLAASLGLADIGMACPCLQLCLSNACVPTTYQAVCFFLNNSDRQTDIRPVCLSSLHIPAYRLSHLSTSLAWVSSLC